MVNRKAYKNRKLKKGIGGVIMENKNLKSININELLKGKKNKFCSSEEALKDVTPIAWSNDVLAGKKKVIITNAN